MNDLFLDISFPASECIFNQHSIEFFTNLQIAKNGFETRLILSDFGRNKFILEEAIFAKEKVLEICNFFKLVKGRGYSFRFLDETDYTAYNQTLIKTPNGGYFLQKSYKIGKMFTSKAITKPIVGSVEIFAENEILTEGRDYDVNYQTGEIFLNPSLKALFITSSFKFELEVRFESDELQIMRDKFGNFVIKNLILTEVL
jgi:uncharacterized protein (TIGR02217 family)